MPIRTIRGSAPGCIQIWCKFRTKIPGGKYLKMVGSKWTPPCAQTGVKSNLGTKVLSHVIRHCDHCYATYVKMFLSKIHDLILIPGDLRLTSDTILGDLNLIDMFI